MKVIQNTVFDSDLFNKHLKTRWAGQHFRYLESVDSTNTFARESVRELPHGSVILANNQFAGKGQYGRQWKSQPGENLTFSLVLKPNEARYLHMLTLLAALASVRTLNETIPEAFSIRWPNDIHCDTHKVGGILVESSIMGEQVEYVIAGIGLNINQSYFDSTHGDASSLLQLSNATSPFSREVILARYLSVFESLYDRWKVKKDSIREDINKCLNGYGWYGNLKVNGTSLDNSLKFMGICEEGFPVFVSPEGDIKRFRAESVRFTPEKMTLI